MRSVVDRNVVMRHMPVFVLHTAEDTMSMWQDSLFLIADELNLIGVSDIVIGNTRKI